MMKCIVPAALVLMTSVALADGHIDRAALQQLRHLSNGKPIADQGDQLRKTFRRWEADGVPGVTAEDKAILDQARRAKQRAQLLGRFLQDDLDGDLQITSDEYRQRALQEAQRPLRANGIEVPPSPEQIEFLTARAVERSLEPDTNGDKVLSTDEILAHIEAQMAERKSGQDILQDAMIFDLDNDGRLTEDEYVSGMIAFAREIDTNGDGALTGQEIRQAYDQGQRQSSAKAQEDRVRSYIKKAIGEQGGETAADFSMARSACQMTPASEGTEVFVVGGYEGSAMTTLWLGKAKTAELADIKIPAGDTRIMLVAPFFNDTILRLSDPGGRVQQVVSTRGQIGVIGGADDVTITAVDTACHLELNNPVTGENPDPAIFYADRIGTPVTRVVNGYTIGKVDLGAGRNVVDRALTGSVPAPSVATSNAAWAKFLSFNPGGLVPLSKDDVKASVRVGAHDIWPQHAGIAALVAEGALVPLPRDDTMRQVLENDAGEIRMGGKTFVPGSGDDAILMGGLIFTEEKPKTWIGRKPQVYLMTRALTLPVGLTGAHGIHIAIPEGLPEPGNMTRSVKTFPLDSTTFNELMKK